MADPHDAPAAAAAPAAASARPAALLGWRLLALLYDLFPALALWMLAGSLFVGAFTITGHTTHENIAPFSTWQWALWACCWVLTGLYATWSWRRGGQTLGMRPWRIAVTGDDAQAPSLSSLWVRYAVATVSLCGGGLGFWWALIDRDRLTWHDRASGTRMIRRPRR
ncbi:MULTISPECIES: RDD family protein [unclassified Stenotrophomonas]|uniref:RDD family protein n=1 Tax=unclassified Stenotrophomonas TaxID=196198 RepID=UPI00177AB3CD|nr:MULTISPECIES: RDD family protein [unclassified Stenotrophomonas]MBD8644324.1 RDD family protein [Stenotrophomonas sp. CFBP 13724]MDY1033750.1 RDD family protein [Stenotrophomonas sp. CFBP8980]